MTDAPRSDPDPLRVWREAAAADDAAGPAHGETRSPRRLFALVGTVCVVALALAVVAATRPRAVQLPARPLPTPTTAAATPQPAVAAGTAGAPEAGGDADGSAAAAVLAVRRAAAPNRYVDTAVAERVTPLGDLAIVTVRALVLQRAATGWDAGSQARFAVAVGEVEGTATALAPPWAVSVAPEAAPAPRWQTVNDPTLAATARDALRAEGYRISGGVELAVDEFRVDIVQATFRGVAPEADAPADHRVWLAADAHHVLGGRGAAPPVPAVAQP